jgi:hypothetical protein
MFSRTDNDYVNGMGFGENDDSLTEVNEEGYGGSRS